MMVKSPGIGWNGTQHNEANQFDLNTLMLKSICPSTTVGGIEPYESSNPRAFPFHPNPVVRLLNILLDVQRSLYLHVSVPPEQTL